MHDPGRGGGGVQTNIVHVKQTPVRVYSGKMHFFLGGGGVKTNIVHVKQTPVRVYSGKMFFFFSNNSINHDRSYK